MGQRARRHVVRATGAKSNMKRSGFKNRGMPLTARTPVRKVSKKRAAHRASRAGKDEMAYMAAVKEHPCIVCRRMGPSDAHHCIHGRYGARKPSGYKTIPLCKWCHQDGPEAIHRGKRSWEEKHGPDYSYIGQVRAQLPPEILATIPEGE